MTECVCVLFSNLSPSPANVYDLMWFFVHPILYVVCPTWKNKILLLRHVARRIGFSNHYSTIDQHIMNIIRLVNQWWVFQIEHFVARISVRTQMSPKGSPICQSFISSSSLTVTVKLLGRFVCSDIRRLTKHLKLSFCPMGNILSLH